MYLRKTIFILGIQAFLLLCLTGCFAASIDDLFSLPQASEEYLQLQELIDDEISSGSEYLSPTSGTNRQSVQLYDLDGDGMDEAIAFFRDVNQSAKVCIYRSVDGKYEPAKYFTGEGSSIGMVEYADVNSDGWREILITLQASSGLNILIVVSIEGWEPVELLKTDCTKLLVMDFNGDGSSNLLVARLDLSEGGTVVMYSFLDDGEIADSSAAMSLGLESIDRMRRTTLTDGTPALFIEGKYATDLLLTDVFICADGQIRCISMEKNAAVSSTVRSYTVYSRDINGDSSLDIPTAVSVYKQSETSNYWRFDWYSLDSNGESEHIQSTYHCYNDGWYLILPGSWVEGVTVRRDDGGPGVRRVIVSIYDQKSEKLYDVAAIYTLTGENRFDRAIVDDRFVLMSDETTIYAAQFLFDEGRSEYAVSQEEFISLFYPIYSEWITGAE